MDRAKAAMIEDNRVLIYNRDSKTRHLIEIYRGRRGGNASGLWYRNGR